MLLRRWKILFLSFFAALLINGSLLFSAQAQSLSLIRDAEIETYLKNLTAPLYKTASVPNVKIYLVNDSRLNAFVAGGKNIFVNTGLILATRTPDELLSVLAHELSHISKGHLVKAQQQLSRSKLQALVATLVGAAASIAARKPEGIAAGVTLGAQLSRSSFFSFSRTQEMSADNSALSYLRRLNLSPDGMISFLSTLERQNRLSGEQTNLYLRTHPFLKDRIANAKSAKKRNTSKNTLSKYNRTHQRVRAKLAGFLLPESKLNALFPNPRSIEAVYAKSISTFRRGDLNSGLKNIRALIKADPKNPYFQELLGQMLFEHGRLKEALYAYANAIGLAPKESLLWYSLGRTQVALNQPAQFRDAVTNLKKAIRLEKNNPSFYSELSRAYGGMGKIAYANWAQAESASLTNDKKKALYWAKRAKASLPPNSRESLRINDILNQLKKRK